MIRGSQARCRHVFPTILAVALCVVAAGSATAQARTDDPSSVSSETMTAVARERGFLKKRRLDMRHIAKWRSRLPVAVFH